MLDKLKKELEEAKLDVKNIKIKKSIVIDDEIKNAGIDELEKNNNNNRGKGDKLEVNQSENINEDIYQLIFNQGEPRTVCAKYLVSKYSICKATAYKKIKKFIKDNIVEQDYAILQSEMYLKLNALYTKALKNDDLTNAIKIISELNKLLKLTGMNTNNIQVNIEQPLFGPNLGIDFNRNKKDK